MAGEDTNSANVEAATALRQQGVPPTPENVSRFFQFRSQIDNSPPDAVAQPRTTVIAPGTPRAQPQMQAPRNNLPPPPPIPPPAPPTGRNGTLPLDDHTASNGNGNAAPVGGVSATDLAQIVLGGGGLYAAGRGLQMVPPPPTGPAPDMGEFVGNSPHPYNMPGQQGGPVASPNAGGPVAARNPGGPMTAYDPNPVFPEPTPAAPKEAPKLTSAARRIEGADTNSSMVDKAINNGEPPQLTGKAKGPTTEPAMMGKDPGPTSPVAPRSNVDTKAVTMGGAPPKLPDGSIDWPTFMRNLPTEEAARAANAIKKFRL